MYCYYLYSKKSKSEQEKIKLSAYDKWVKVYGNKPSGTTTGRRGSIFGSGFGGGQKGRRGSVLGLPFGRRSSLAKQADMLGDLGARGTDLEKFEDSNSADRTPFDFSGPLELPPASVESIGPDESNEVVRAEKKAEASLHAMASLRSRLAIDEKAKGSSKSSNSFFNRLLGG